jgi:exopolyphosphatase/guanosine-5'-triphosphate,3'-diphosphate pyrophosphatase
MERIAAIDIGSNAVRLTTADLKNSNTILLDEKIRIPLRLGTDAFGPTGAFTKNFIEYAKAVFCEIHDTLISQDVDRFRAVATSALRDAKNNDVFINAIKKSSGIDIQLIDGDTEARYILNAIANSNILNKKDDFLLFDLGGGSLELSLIEHDEIIESKSINLGTVRLLEYSKRHGAEETNEWILNKVSKMKKFLKNELKKSNGVTVIGTGGNFRRLVKLNKIYFGNDGDSITLKQAKEVLSSIEATPYLDRIQRFEFRPDRADVIVGALKVIISVLEDLPVKAIKAPNVGLTQGVLFEMSDGKTDSDQLL